MNQKQPDSIYSALLVCRRSFLAVGVFSFFANILMLTPIFYMMNVFDKAVSTGSLSTLAALVSVIAFLYLCLMGFEWVRSIILVHISARLDRLLAPSIYKLCFKSSAGSLDGIELGSQPLSDLNGLRQFLGSQSVTFIFDIVWVPFLLVLMVFFNPYLAVVAVICMAIMAGIAIANRSATSELLVDANKKNAAQLSSTSRNLQNAEVAESMGMVDLLTERWLARQEKMLSSQLTASSRASGFTSAIKTLSMAMQSVAITTGAILVIQQQITPGVMIAASMLLGRCIQPVTSAVTAWPSVVTARDQYDRLNGLIEKFPASPPKMELPPIVGGVDIHGLTVTPPGAKRPSVKDASLSLKPGTVTMILGPSGAGKSSLIRAMLGIWPHEKGYIRLDGSSIRNYDKVALGPQIGYLPQNIALFDGTIADNIARFNPVDSEAVIQAAKDAGVHKLILRLAEGYDTRITNDYGELSPGQKQRIALARAVYHRPRLIFLDEPNSNLDQGGERALNKALEFLKASGATIVMVSHRTGALPLVDHIIFMESGKVVKQGPADDIMPLISDQSRSASAEHLADQGVST